MERLHAHIGSVQTALQQTPEVFHAIGVNFAVHIFNGVIDDGVVVVRVQPFIGLKFIAVDRCSCFYVLTNLRLQSRLTAVIHNECPHVTAALHHAHDHGFIFSASASDDASTL